MERAQRPITDRQLQVLRYVQRHQEMYGYAPSVRDIARDVCNSTHPNAARVHLSALVKKGYVQRSIHARSIVVLKDYVPDGDANETSQPVQVPDDSTSSEH